MQKNESKVFNLLNLPKKKWLIFYLYHVTNAYLVSNSISEMIDGTQECLLFKIVISSDQRINCIGISCT